MRSLFLKIFLWFWLTVLSVGAALAVSIAFSANTSQMQIRLAASELLPDSATTAAQRFERSGEPALAGFLHDVENKYRVQTFFFNQSGHELLAGWGMNSHVPSADVIAARDAIQEHDELYVRGDIAGQRVNGPSGQPYSLILRFNPLLPATKPAAVKTAVVFLPVVTLVVGGFFCYLITRHITRPLVRMREATAALAAGDLGTRVTPRLGHRQDEIAALGRDFDRMAERIEALIAGHKRLLGDVSHELRSPLSRLLVALGLARKDATSALAEPLSRIALEAHRLDHLIGQLLILSRIESGLQTGSKSSVDLANLVQEVAADADFEARSHNRKVAVISAETGSVFGSEELLGSAVENVVRNAVRFTAENTAVEISLKSDARQTILHVRDYGPGVPDSMLAEIFLPFRRVSHAELSIEGSGLGLAIAQRAVVAHGGEIQALNAADGGLIVEIRFPAG
jgi:two-component system sensor histidine kinase CpxA